MLKLFPFKYSLDSDSPLRKNGRDDVIYNYKHSMIDAVNGGYDTFVWLENDYLFNSTFLTETKKVYAHAVKLLGCVGAIMGSNLLCPSLHKYKVYDSFIDVEWRGNFAACSFIDIGKYGSQLLNLSSIWSDDWDNKIGKYIIDQQAKVVYTLYSNALHIGVNGMAFCKTNWILHGCGGWLFTPDDKIRGLYNAFWDKVFRFRLLEGGERTAEDYIKTKGGINRGLE